MGARRRRLSRRGASAAATAGLACGGGVCAAGAARAAGTAAAPAGPAPGVGERASQRHAHREQYGQHRRNYTARREPRRGSRVCRIRYVQRCQDRIAARRDERAAPLHRRVARRRAGPDLGFVFAVVTNFVSYWFSDKIVLKMYGAQEVGPDHVLYRIVEPPGAARRPAEPRCYVIPQPSPNAFATGRNPAARRGGGDRRHPADSERARSSRACSPTSWRTSSTATS